MPISLSGKKYALNKQVSKCAVMAFFLSKISVVSLVLTGYRFVLPCLHFMHLALLDHSTPGYLQQDLSDKTKDGMPGRELHYAEELRTKYRQFTKTCKINL